MSDIQQTSENTLLWFIVAAIFGLLCLIIWLFHYENLESLQLVIIIETIMMIEDIC